MKNTKYIILALLLFAGKLVWAQTDSNFESLISKEWKMVSYEADGEKFPPTAKTKKRPDDILCQSHRNVNRIG
jgi:hypothetical protein